MKQQKPYRYRDDLKEWAQDTIADVTESIDTEKKEIFELQATAALEKELIGKKLKRAFKNPFSPERISESIQDQWRRTKTRTTFGARSAQRSVQQLNNDAVRAQRSVHRAAREVSAPFQKMAAGPSPLVKTMMRLMWYCVMLGVGAVSVSLLIGGLYTLIR